MKHDRSDSESDMEWEEVDVIPSEAVSVEPAEPTVEQTLEIQVPVKKRRTVDKRQRIIQQLMHKAHLMLLLVAMHMKNQWCNDQVNQSLLLSLAKPMKCTRENIKAQIRHFKEQDLDMFDEKDLNLVFVCLCRSIGWETRLIAVLNPIPLSLSKTKQEQSFYFCSEIYDTQKRQWLIVDCMNDFIGNKYREELLSFKISYVLGFEQDGTVKDLTQRYTSYWNTVSRKRRLPDKPGGLEWWNVCLWLYSKSQRTVKDDLDDVSLLESVKQEKMPTRLDDFINHPIYALERHLKKNQIIDPKTVIGVYKSQNVYSRANVQDLFTMQQWRRMGKTVVGQPMKQVVIKNQPEDLYAASQTQEMERPPLMNGKIPKSLYGNVELFHPNMLPLECVHVQEPHAHTVAKTLGLDFGRAVVDFSYGKRVHPIYDGIVLKAVDRQLLMEALESYLGSLQEQEQSKREKRVLDRWRLLTARLLLKERLEREYA